VFNYIINDLVVVGAMWIYQSWKQLRTYAL